MLPLILASSSPARRELLNRLGLAYRCVSPDIDETPLLNEKPQELALRLAQSKVYAIGACYPDSLVIGSDQVAVLDNEIMGKPGSRANAVQQLQRASGKEMLFFTAVCLLNTKTSALQRELVPYSVIFRQLDEQKIDNYVRREEPYGCAGAFKSEGLGIALFTRMQGDDPTALIGLPLIALIQMLENEGATVL